MISIILPVRNGEKHLKMCLDSIVAQTEPHWELIIVNNQSTDRTAEIIDTFCRQDKRIHTVYNQGYPGIIDALQLGYQTAKGTFITRMDADDLMPPQKLQQLKEVLTTHGTGHVATGLVNYFSNEELKDGFLKYEKWLNQLTRHGINFQEIYKECVIPSPCWMVHRSDFDRCGAFHSSTYPEDYDLCFRFYEQGLKVIASQQVLHLWRDHIQRNSRNDPHYADQLFFELKLKFFMKIDRTPLVPLIISGAGRKGKKLAQLLIKENITFEWVSNNPHKVGHVIYGKTIKNENEYTTPAQVLIAISGPAQQLAYQDWSKKEGFVPYLFC